MKNFLIITLFLAFTNLNAQLFLSASFDARNATFGSKQTDYEPELNYILTFGAISNKKVVVSMIYEGFNKLGFKRWGFELGKEIKLIPKTKLTITGDFGIIDRRGAGYYYYGGNANFSYEISDKIRVFIKTQVLKRNDIEDKLVRRSNFVGIQYNVFQSKRNKT